jgi:hypothetical protein
MQLPRINPVGVIEYPDGYVLRARRLPISLRVVALAILASFVAVTTVTTVFSLGRFCLTSQASAASPFQGP